MKLRRRFYLVGIFPIVLMLLCASVSSCGGHRESISDCVWAGEASAWLDNNKSGIRSPGDPPLPGVRFLIDDTLNHHTGVGGSALSDAAGMTHLSVWLPGCPEVKFEVYAEPPPGYVPTTPIRVPTNGNNKFSFGFVKGN
jgi:hypothetical protein